MPKRSYVLPDKHLTDSGVERRVEVEVELSGIELAADSELARAMAAQHVRINSLHHQVLDQLGRSMRAVAWDGDNLVQAIESCDHRLLIGVQWYPQYRPYPGYQLRLFRCLVAQARDHRQTRLL